MPDWSEQKSWLERIYPDLLTWYQTMPWQSLRPGLGPAIYRFFMDYDVRHWVARTDGGLSGTLSWQANFDHNDRLWAAVPSQGGELALTALLLDARKNLSWRQSLILDYPAGENDASIEAAGFQANRTLLWMKLQEENPVNLI
jgi:hypothetical protein